MNQVILKYTLACMCLIAGGAEVVHAQKLTGVWKGYFQTEDGQHYTLEFQIKQNNNGSVTGVSYSYGSDIEFYGKATMVGSYTVSNSSFIIQETRTVEVKTSGGTCLMNYRFTYSKSGKEEFLTGTYVGKMEDRRNPKNNGVWGDCGGGKVYLRRVTQSDFYLEPFLKETKPETPKTNTPATKTPVKTTKPPVVNRTTPPKTTTTPKKDTIKRNTPDIIVMDKPVAREPVKIPPTTRSRENELVQTLLVSNEEISVRLYDNGEVDNDTISVYLDGKAIVANKRLSTTPITLSLKLDEENPEHVLVMVAENLGRIPPNTSLMIVQDGDKRYQVSITSTEQKNAMVRFRYQKK